MHEEVADAEPALKSGAMVTHNIRLARKLGDGGMGTVWLADHLGLGSQVVIKFMSPALARDERWTERFRREAELAARVRHPHVVQIFDHGVTSDGVPFIVMELLEGHDLGQEIWDRGCLLPGEVSTIVVQVAKALQRVHELGFVHRDVKPENIFLCDLGSGEIFIKLLDFGIAKTRHDETSSLTSTGVTMGTPYYMSPEVIVSAKNVDQKTDLWALAVVAFEALTGQRPFLGETIAAVALQLHADERPRATKIVPSLPAEIDEWFARALSRNPEDRFPEARAMARAFAAILPPIRNSFTPDAIAPFSTTGRRDETAPVATTQAIEPAAPPPRAKWPWIAGAAVVAVVVAALAWPATPPRIATPTAAASTPAPAAEPTHVVEPPVVVATAPVPDVAPSASTPKSAPTTAPTAPVVKKKPKPRVHDFNDIE
jgi:eukaryotic-like serine/threonine-protein kinase